MLNRIRHISKAAGLVKSADVLFNTTELIKNLNRYGFSFFKNFHADAEEKVKYESKRLQLLKKYHKNPLLKELENNVKTLEKIVTINKRA